LYPETILSRQRAEYRGHHLPIGSPTCRGVAVDQMNAPTSQPRPFFCHGHRIRNTHALVGVRSAHELHTGVVAEIDGGNHLHATRSSITALTKARPANELFSGWNCTPTVFARRTIEANLAS